MVLCDVVAAVSGLDVVEGGAVACDVGLDW